MKKAVDIISTVLIALLLMLLCAVFILKLCFGIEMKAIMTASMKPELPVGSLVVILPTDYEDINIGDDITFVRDEELTLVTHRVVAKDETRQQFTTQGIANNSADAPIIYQNVVGKVVWHIPYIGYLVIWLSTLWGKIIAVVLIIALVLISLLFDKNSKTKEKTQKNKTNSEGRKINIKKLTIGGICVTLTAAISIGGTLAYLTAKAEKENIFKFTTLDAMLTEPYWDGIVSYAYDETTGEITPIQYTKPQEGENDPYANLTELSTLGTTDNPYGKEAAKNMIPGTVAKKNPMITNICDIDEYIAAQITFVYSSSNKEKAGQPLSVADYAKVTAVIEIDYDADKEGNWERINSTTADSVTQSFVYKGAENGKVASQNRTEPLFNTVKVKESATNEQLKVLEDIGGFVIWIEGCAVQYDTIEDIKNDEGTVIKTAYEIFKDGIKFSNTPTETTPVNIDTAGGIISKNTGGFKAVAGGGTV